MRSTACARRSASRAIAFAWLRASASRTAPRVLAFDCCAFSRVSCAGAASDSEDSNREVRVSTIGDAQGDPQAIRDSRGKTDARGPTREPAREGGDAGGRCEWKVRVGVRGWGSKGGRSTCSLWRSKACWSCESACSLYAVHSPVKNCSGAPLAPPPPPQRPRPPQPSQPHACRP